MTQAEDFFRFFNLKKRSLESVLNCIRTILSYICLVAAGDFCGNRVYRERN